MVRKVSLPALALALLVPACDAPGPSEATFPAEISADAESALLQAGGRQVVMLDACDPASFNEAFGFEVCTPVSAGAGIPFATFIALLERNQQVNAWRFAPEVIRVTRTTTMRVPNLGGIPHSFTEVEEFGGGFVPLLNALSGNPDPAPECVDPGNPNVPNSDVRLIPPGQADEITFVPGESKKYICCIHPWMRAVSG